MKRIGIWGTTVLFAMFGFTAMVRAQEQHDEKAAPEKHQEEAKPAEKPHQDEKAPKPERQDARPQEQHDQGRMNDRQNQENKDQEKAARDQQKQEEKAQKDQQKDEDQQRKQTEEQQKAAQHDQQKDNDQRRNNQPAYGQQQDTHRAIDQQRVQQDNRPAYQPQQQENRPAYQQQQRGNGGEQRAAFQEHRARNWQSEHKTWAQRGGYRGYRIPEDRFRTSFGEAHRFRLASFPVEVVDGFPRFQINGFWVALVDPWPEYWADDWYNTDDCYVTYDDDGYYLEDVRYPGVRLAINIFVG